MAQCTQSAHEFIQSAFCPLVAVMCSEDAEKICQKNNLSFVEMVRPFCHLTSEGNKIRLFCSKMVTDQWLRQKRQNCTSKYVHERVSKTILSWDSFVGKLGDYLKQPWKYNRLTGGAWFRVYLAILHYCILCDKLLLLWSPAIFLFKEHSPAQIDLF